MHGLHVEVNAGGVTSGLPPHPYPAQRTFRTPGTGGDTSAYTEMHAITEIVVDVPCHLLLGVEVVSFKDALSILPHEQATPTIAELRQDFTVSPALAELGSTVRFDELRFFRVGATAVRRSIRSVERQPRGHAVEFSSVKVEPSPGR